MKELSRQDTCLILYILKASSLRCRLLITYFHSILFAISPTETRIIPLDADKMFIEVEGASDYVIRSRLRYFRIHKCLIQLPLNNSSYTTCRYFCSREVEPSVCLRLGAKRSTWSNALRSGELMIIEYSGGFVQNFCNNRSYRHSDLREWWIG